MPKLTIDGREVEVPEGATILEAARKLGMDVPTLCHREGGSPSTSCMVCVVKLLPSGRLVPSCTAPAEDGLVVESEADEVRQARQTALELLLGDHLGDCEAPCQAICPAGLRIPKLARAIAAGRTGEAAAVARTDLVLPATLGRICPAPCEKGCRRGQHDAAVSIRLLHRFAADTDRASPAPRIPPREPDTGKRIAIVGAGPTGLAAAFALLRQGHACTVYDDHDWPGGMLRYGVPPEELPRGTLDAEIEIVRQLGAEFRLGTRVGEAVAFDALRDEFDAVVVARGEMKGGQAERFGLETSKTGIQVDRASGATSLDGVFAGGDSVRKSRMAVRAVADGKTMAASIGQYLVGETVAGPPRRLSVHIGQVDEDEMAGFLAEADARPRVEPAGGPGAGLTGEEARAEAERCLHCDCRCPESCKLRLWSERLGAKTTRYKAEGRRRFVQRRGRGILYEPGKCIDCGICIQIAEAAREPRGLSFIGRGFDVRVGVPFGEGLAEGLGAAAAQCADACPTGALAQVDAEE